MEENILKQAGLSEEQSLVYETLINKGPQKASSVSSWTGIKRGLTYKVLEQLENMGLISKKGGSGAVAVFYPAHPSVLLDKIERDKKNLDLAKEIVSLGIGSLSSKYNLIAGKPNVRFFEGEDAIEKITTDYPTKDKEIRQWIDINNALNHFRKETIKYKDERIKKNISKKMIVTDTIENREYTKNNPTLTDFKFTKKKLPTAIQIYDEKVSMLTLEKDKQIGIIIEDKAISETLKNIFDEIWEKTNSQSLDLG
jgi:sugar-specific transcriptional regulator TrmB